MEQKQLEQLKKSLAEEKSLIEKELSEISQKNPKIEGNFDVRFPQYGQGKDENAQEVTEYETRRALEASLEKKLEEINQTLKKLEDDNYGICENCSSEIEKPRLKAMPTAFLCVSCAKIQK